MFKLALELDGEKECVRDLNELAKAVRGPILQRAVSAAIDVFVEPIRQRAPRASGELADSVSSRIKYYSRSGRVAAYAGPSYPRGSHGSIVEYGTQPRRTAKGHYRGSGPAQPFVGPAYEATVGRAQSVLERELAAGIAAEASK